MPVRRRLILRVAYLLLSLIRTFQSSGQLLRPPVATMALVVYNYGNHSSPSAGAVGPRVTQALAVTAVKALTALEAVAVAGELLVVPVVLGDAA